ncbi:hypothetical protein ACJMK2_034626, partial [Sinanodonta woodiana]
MIVDEYITVRGRQFFGVNIHDSGDKTSVKTGFVRTFGTCTALDMVESLKQHLSVFGITMERDLVGSTMDGDT